MNRSFPGSEKGSLAARLAKAFLDEVVVNSDYGIDLHTGASHRDNFPQIRGNLDDPATLELAKVFGAPVAVNSNIRDGSLRECAADRGLPMLIYEAGEALRFDERAVRAGVKGIASVMRELEMLPVNEYGQVSPDDVAARLRPETAVVSVMHANNEVGSINPIDEIGAVCREAGVPLHTDAVQGAAHLPVDVQAMQVDMMSIGAHKMYGPKGMGVLYVRQDTPLLPMQTGGGQEGNRRAGTSNVPYIVGQAEAQGHAGVEHLAVDAGLAQLVGGQPGAAAGDDVVDHEVVPTAAVEDAVAADLVEHVALRAGDDSQRPEGVPSAERAAANPQRVAVEADRFEVVDEFGLVHTINTCYF